MVSYLKGKVVISNHGLVILETGGVGYKVNISPVLLFLRGDEIDLFVHEHIREDADDLYGFITYDELILFEQLISVNGVGPKAGLNIMSVAPPKRIVSAILSDDISFFVAIPGIGKKVAAKIILDLKSKLSGNKNITFEVGRIDQADELLDALAALGYTKQEIVKILPKMPAEIKTLEDKIRWSLKNLAKQ